MRNCLLVIALGCISTRQLLAADPGVAFFEQKIRPVLVEHCYRCHSAEAMKAKGGLRLDTQADVRKGGDSGPALVASKPMDSLIIKALRHDEIAMPPNKRLPDEVIADFERWIAMGAPDPRQGATTTVQQKIDLEAGRKFWSFVPPKASPVPATKDTAWPRNDIDRFILAKLEEKHLAPAADADPRVLIRRISIALTGLPPTPEEVAAFEQSATRNPQSAIKELVERLLASPHFGERWGRHWLDIARYADSNGKDENFTFHAAWRYRDYVINAFNNDKPYNRFIREQVAGDLLPDANDEALTATGFLVLGPKVLADRDQPKRKADVIDEQIDTLGRAILGMTLGCARCHDHKFDPVPTVDYYALAGIFSSTRTLDGIKGGNAVIAGWLERPLGPGGEKQLGALKAHQKQVAAISAEIKKIETELKGHEDKATMRVAGNLIGITVDDKDAQLVGKWKASMFSRPYVGEGYIHDDKSGQGEKSATFIPKLPKAGEYEVYISYTAAAGRSKKTPVTVRSAEGEKTILINQEQKPEVDGMFRQVGKFRFAAGTAGSVTISNKDTEGYVIVDAVRWVPTGALGSDPEMAMGVPDDVKLKIAASQKRLKELQEQEKALKQSAPPEPVMVMAVRDEAKIADVRINIRGNPHSLGEVAPRGFLQVVPPVADAPGSPLPTDQSGRLQLADWLTNPRHPLVARVWVNRVWAHLFGEGLVRSVDNFGVQGDRPSHPELLDYLTLRFIDNGWSTKKLIQEIMASRAYQLGGQADPALLKADPENRLLGRANRRRAEAEVIRDAILVVSGKLDRTIGGSSVSHIGDRAIDNTSKGDLQSHVESNVRRSVYLPVIRNDLPAFFEVFDFADPDVTTGRRDATTVATQALYLLNSPFAQQQAEATAKRLLALPGDDAGRLNDLYRRALGRTPSDKETQVALSFLEQFQKSGKPKSDPKVEAWTALCQALFGCTEFRFIE